MRRLLLAALISILSVGFTYAGDPAPSPAPPLPAEIRPLPTPLVPQSVPQLAGEVQFFPAAGEADAPPVLLKRVPSMSTVQHLREAAHHLEAAGYIEQAQELRKDADEIVAAADLLMQKRAALEQLQREIAELEATTGAYQQVMLRCRIVEIDRGAAAKLGFEQLHGRTAIGAVAPERLDGLLDELVHRHVAKIIAQPNLLTINGRPGSLRIGGEIPIISPAGGGDSSVDWRETGFSMDAIPVCLGADRLRLEIAAEVATPDFAKSSVVNAGGNVAPIMEITRVRTQVEMCFGETKVIGGMICRRDPRMARESAAADGDEGSTARETELLVIVTAEPVRGIPAASTDGRQPADAPGPR
jgi:Flp pilus assembly secretin CpaC